MLLAPGVMRCVPQFGLGCEACDLTRKNGTRHIHQSSPLVASFCFVAGCLPPFFFVLLDVAVRMRVAYCLLQDTSCCVACCSLLYAGCVLLRAEHLQSANMVAQDCVVPSPSLYLESSEYDDVIGSAIAAGKHVGSLPVRSPEQLTTLQPDCS